MSINLMEDHEMGEMKEVTIKLTDDQRNQIKSAIGQDITEVKVSADRGNPLAATPLGERANPLMAELTDRANPSARLEDRANPSAALADRANPSAALADRANPSAALADRANPSAALADRANPSAALADRANPSAALADRANPSFAAEE
jgi:hypothetical protein